jgi:KDO2-lipid IV(A) lauroyltransferase
VKNIRYYLLAAPVYLLSMLPPAVQYALSDLAAFLLYRVAGYRKKVVMTNLKNAFPEKPETELRSIAGRYYHFMTDTFIETFRLLTISTAELAKRVRFANMEVVTEQTSKGRSIIFVMGHYGNWEWCAPAFQATGIAQLDVLYHPLRNPSFNRLTNTLRTRTGVHAIPMRNALREMVARKNILTATAFIADQAPQPEISQWVTFLNQDTPVFTGTEKIAKKLNLPVVFASVRKVKRGYYDVHFTLVTDSPVQTVEGWITSEHTRLLEAEIRHMPETWLWSHKRWKHKRI